MKGIGPSGGTGTTGEDVGEDDDADDEPGEPRWDASIGSPLGKDSRHGAFCFGDSFDGLSGTNHSDEEVGDDEEDEDGKEKVAEGLGFKAGAEILNLSDVAVALTNGPELDADHEEAGGVDQAGGRGHEAVGADPAAESLTGRAHERKGGHGGAEDGHQQHEGADGVAGDEVVLRGASEEGLRKESESEKEREVNTDDDNSGHDRLVVVVSFRPFLKMSGPCEFCDERPEAGSGDRVTSVVEKADGHEAEDEVRFIPVPDILVEHCEEQKDGNDDPRFLHEIYYRENGEGLTLCRRDFPDPLGGCFVREYLLS